MSRLFWVALGATAGVLVVRRLTKAAEALTPQGISESLAASIRTLGEAIRDFGEDVRAGMSERETELNDALGLETADTTAVNPADADRGGVAESLPSPRRSL